MLGGGVQLFFFLLVAPTEYEVLLHRLQAWVVDVKQSLFFFTECYRNSIGFRVRYLDIYFAAALVYKTVYRVPCAI